GWSQQLACDVPEVTPGTILGHEAVGIIVETGSAVTTLAKGDRVLVSCISACGRCRFCKEARYGRHLALQGARAAQRRAGAVPRRHPADRLRGRRSQRQCHSW